MNKLDKATARMLFEQYRTWFGSPRIVLNNETIDGRIREEVRSEVLGNATRQPLASVTIFTSLDADAAKYLALAGHYERARQYIPEALWDAESASIFCNCSRELVAPIFLKRPRICTPMKPHTTPRRRQAIERIAILLREAREGVGYVTAERIAECLKPWL